MYGFYTRDKTTGAKGKLDIAVVEATAITEEGHIVPGARSVGDCACAWACTDVIVQRRRHA
jgi:acyl-CoA hydrolase